MPAHSQRIFLIDALIMGSYPTIYIHIQWNIEYIGIPYPSDPSLPLSHQQFIQVMGLQSDYRRLRSRLRKQMDFAARRHGSCHGSRWGADSTEVWKTLQEHREVVSLVGSSARTEPRLTQRWSEMRILLRKKHHDASWSWDLGMGKPCDSPGEWEEHSMSSSCYFDVNICCAQVLTHKSRFVNFFAATKGLRRVNMNAKMKASEFSSNIKIIKNP